MKNRIVIVGGGSAGWLTAGIIAAEYRDRSSVSIVLVEAPGIATVGVGEGTWPTMRSTLKKIGISETEFIKKCSASFKQGSKFVGWSGLDGDSYYHPFTAPSLNDTADAFSCWQHSRQRLNFSQAVSPQSSACDLHCAPKQLATPEYAGVLNYGYHLDAGAFGTLLKHHCINSLGVELIEEKVVGVENDATGYIDHLVLDSSRLVEGDLFIDCSGSRSLLIGQHFGVKFNDLSKTSINNRALAAHIPYEREDQEIESVTVSTAQDSGWIWDIGLSSRRGVGYVYSSDFCCEDRASDTLLKYIENNNSRIIPGINIKSIVIEPGYREEFWHKNCVAVGMSAGFIEPLEASALALVELSANMIRDNFPRNKPSMEIIEKRFNNIFKYRWGKIEEFLKLHYVLSKRRDSPYWKEVTRLDSCPEGLRNLLLLWENRPPNTNDFLHTEELFPAASYQYILYGMGFLTTEGISQRRTTAIENSKSYFTKIDLDVQKISSHLPTNRQLIAKLSKSSFPLF